ncbi:hypothetical protein R1flu_005499 [Riccia fluitans]|uniref:Uncharacterized protein n=1 Tax=Riccia fluitans TaxID=41844 RepID=A0ABD1YTL6_9MARC
MNFLVDNDPWITPQVVISSKSVQQSASSQVDSDPRITTEVVISSRSFQRSKSSQVYSDPQIVHLSDGPQSGVTFEHEVSDPGIISFCSNCGAGYTSSALERRSTTGLNDYKVVESEVKAVDMFDSDDDYQPSPPKYNLCSPKYFLMPPTPWNSSYNGKFFEDDNYFPEPPSPNSFVEGVTHLAGEEYFPVPPRIPKFNYPNLEAKEDNEYNPESSVYPKINYSNEDE